LYEYNTVDALHTNEQHANVVRMVQTRAPSEKKVNKSVAFFLCGGIELPHHAWFRWIAASFMRSLPGVRSSPQNDAASCAEFFEL
jgi:hypothetical protein